MTNYSLHTLVGPQQPIASLLTDDNTVLWSDDYDGNNELPLAEYHHSDDDDSIVGAPPYSPLSRCSGSDDEFWSQLEDDQEESCDLDIQNIMQVCTFICDHP